MPGARGKKYQPPSLAPLTPNLSSRTAHRLLISTSSWLIWFVLFGWLIWFIWLVSFNQINKTNQMNQMNKRSSKTASHQAGVSHADV